MNKFESASILAGMSPNEEPQVSEPTNLHVITGEVVANSENGSVLVSMDGLVFSEDDTQYIEMDTIGGLEEGDEATIILAGEAGSSMTPLAIGSTGSVDRLSARVIETELLLADKASIDDLEAATARIGDLEADHVSVDTLEAATARIENLEVDHVSISDFEVEQANIDNLQAATADIDTIRANSAKVQNLTAAQLEADHATIGTLDTTYMHADMANADVAWIENGTIKNGSIVSAMINDVSANKLTAGTINGSVINVTNLNADNITTGTINGQRIGEGSLSLSKLEENVYTETEVDNIVDGLNDRIDGAIETHTGTAVPTLNNSPASAWNTTALRDEHVGDVYYVVNSQSQQNGYCYRFTKSGSTYSWQLIKDSDVTAALSRLTTAEGKITTFDSDISTLKTTTGTLTTKTTSLETRMSDAESDILDKVDTTTFNEVSDTVDSHSQSITQMTTTLSNKADSSTVTAVTNRVSKNEQDISGINTTIGELEETVEAKADGSTVSTISNKLNTVSNTVDGHTQTLTNVQNTLETKADGSTVSTLTTKVNTIEDTVDGHTQTISGQSTILSNNGLTSSTNITNRVSSVEQDLSGYKTTVSETYATQTALATTNGNVTAAQTAADNAQASADRANGRQVAYSATSSTGASTAAKVAACTNFPALAAGATVTVRFSAANTSTGAVTLNVNSTGAKTVYVNGAATSSSNQLLWGANANITFTYDGSYWRVDSEPRTWYGTGSVAAATAAKTATINEVVICKGTTVVLNMTNENTSTSATLNVTSTGAKNIYYGTTTTRPTTANGYGWSAGSTVSLTFDGQYWRIGDTTALARLTAAESTISSHTTSISQNASAIALKADSSTTYTKTDVDGLISTEVTNRNAAITAKANEITSSVSETYATKSSVNGKADASDVTALAGRVTTAESNITQNAQNIELKVSKDGVISSINQSAETVKIQASKVEIDGTAIFTAISDDVDDAITGKGYQTSSQVESAITSKGYATTTQAQGYANTVQDNLNASRAWYAECTTAAATVAKVATITPATTAFTLTTGVVVNVKFSVTNTGAVGSLTLNVNGTGAKNIKTQRSNSLTNLANAGILYANVVIPFIYNGQYWLAIENYNSDTYNRVRWQNVVTILEKPTGTWRILCGTASGYKQVGAGISFDLAYPLLAFSNQPEANATADTGYLSMNGLTFSNTAAIQSGAAGKTIFLKGTVSGNTFTIDSTNVFTTVVPTSEDGAFYIPLGIMTSATQAYFKSSKDLYAYLDGRFRQVTPTEIMASQRIYYRSKVSGTVPKPTAWVTLATNQYNDTVSVGNSGWSTKVTPIAASKAENVAKYLYLYTCEQRKRLDGTVECTSVTLDENTTIIDGGNIITHTVTAEQLNATSINASKTLTVGAMTDAAAETILNSNISVGGRNLVSSLVTNWRRTTVSESSSVGTSWEYMSRTASTTRISAIDLIPVDGDFVTVSLASGYDAFLTFFDANGYMKKYLTWSNQRTVDLSNYSGVTAVGLTVRKSGNSTITLDDVALAKIKLEKGNVATDWSPAPEDVDSAISDAAKTATSYVTEITGQNGIMVHPSTDDDTGVRITSDVDILRNGYSVINVGTQGDTSGNTDAGVTIYDGTTNENVVATFDGDGIGLVGGAFRLTSERVTEEYGDENNPTTMTEIRSVMKSEGSNDDYETRCFLRSMVGEDDDAYYNTIELTSETDIKTQSPTETNNASVEVGSDQWGSSVRLVADSQELHLHKHPIDGKDYFDLHSEVFLMSDYHNGVNMWSTVPGTVLWSGGWHMTAGHTANLKYNVSTCPTGIVLHFQPYTNSTIRNWNHIYYFVPKEHVASYNGSGIVVRLGNPDFSNMASKYLYISNDHITGNDLNNTTGTNSGITYNNAAWVMTQVIAV